MPPGQMQKQGASKARKVRLDRGVGLDGPLPDILGFVERGFEIPVGIFEDLGDDLAGVYLPRDGNPVILLNGSDPAPRLRFTLAHELAHHAFSDDRREDSHAGVVKAGHYLEVRANAFAAELLMPREAVEVWCESIQGPLALDTIVEMAEHFGVSAIAALFRLQSCEVLLDAERAERLKEEINANGHQVLARDVFADSLSEALRRLPRVPVGSVLAAAARADMSLKDAAARLGASPALLEGALDDLRLAPPA